MLSRKIYSNENKRMMQLPKMLKMGMQRLRLSADWQEQFQTDAAHLMVHLMVPAWRVGKPRARAGISTIYDLHWRSIKRGENERMAIKQPYDTIEYRIRTGKVNKCLFDLSVPLDLDW